MLGRYNVNMKIFSLMFFGVHGKKENYEKLWKNNFTKNEIHKFQISYENIKF